ncbi:DUF177 domain-containing protein [Robertkochia marina]|uniref:DUF177 domain-containing protein n=1 Tax=Robertkochia marina TaxID=1227945 RepID=A0A4S3M4K0_9FLAO|nr:DUF177 domain-containing protein [Robertkochia marina]THD69241.1 DUF177 domain-containing protein [Robertkochia marina]TRZ47672.1 DUF177 domain-containing protein [Robertkochia marina]
MKQLKEFDIPFVGLKLGKHRFDYQIDKTFFEAFNYDEFAEATLKVNLVMDKKSNMLELSFKVDGVVNVPCDLTDEPFDQPVEGNLHLVVKFGEEYNDENEELLIIPHGEHQINVAQYIYEMIVLAVPAKRVHPGVKDGTLSSELLQKLEEFQPKEENKNNDGDTDPRWDTLKKLLTDK